ncbi:MAG: MFS transporter [Chloroflexi bacterium]|nr:MFS transporter [Chloroflexota bacterium]
MLALVVACYTAFGILSSSLAPLVTPVMHDLHLDATQMGFVLGTWQLVYIFVAFWGGALVDRFGLKRAITAGMLFLALSAALRGFASDFTSLALAVGLFGIGGPMISSGIPKLVSTWFSGRERGTAVGIANIGPALGGVIILSTASSILVPLTGSWRGSQEITAGVCLIVGIVWWLLARDLPEQADDSPHVVRASGPLAAMGHLLRVRNVAVILGGAAAIFGIGHGLGQWLPNVLEAKGLSPTEAGFFASFSTAAGIISTLLSPRIAAAGNRRLTIMIMFGGQFLALTGLCLLAGPGLALLLPVLGFFRQGIGPLVQLILMETPEVGTRHMGTVGGLYFALGEIGGFGGPFVMGWLLDLTGSFASGILMLAALALLLVVLASLLQEGRHATLNALPS